jgi:hypothetical protein
MFGVVDVSCPGREATTPARLHSKTRRGLIERQPRITCGSPSAAPFIRYPVHVPSGACRLPGSAASEQSKGQRVAAGNIWRGASRSMKKERLMFIAGLAGILGAALQLFASVAALAPDSVAVISCVRVDVSCPGREATTPARLHS